MRMFEGSSNRKNRLAVGGGGRSGRGRRFFLIIDDVNTDSSIALHSGSSESDARPVTTPGEVSETSSGRSDRWAVVLFDDAHHSMDYVIWALLKTLPELSTADASLIMLEAHNTGKGVVTLCGLAQAEKYRDALRILQLRCEIELGW
jgi:ATP-dependent Clp protease adaptor protein ClpS